ncbi:MULTISPECIES: PilN domain-containing protein [unclassified Thioalkalivibrio]|uniref:PilN domain-containing protein n=1 Tax=unclassified Thioalkalivibrio TaxID=2621013 RepID=UPI00036860DC|nr:MULTISPECIES: PilN domain-containing protein [unclassified Thioalkalivibrio]PYG04246.1 type IV pilus assembly protein PilN [Thioalkalivibrio sp. ALE21]
MIYVNLLPWRERAREQRRKQFFVSVGVAAAVGVVLAFGGYTYMESLIDHQEDRNQVLEEEIRELDRKIAEIEELEEKREDLVARMDVIQTLQAQRPEAVHLFDQMVVTLPDGTYVNEITQDGSRIQIRGLSESNTRISAMMRNLDDSPWLGSSNLQIIETREEGRIQVRDFRLDARQTRPDNGE